MDGAGSAPIGEGLRVFRWRRCARLAGALVLLIAAAGCSGADAAATAPVTTSPMTTLPVTTSPATTSPATANSITSTAGPAAGEREFVNPVVDVNFPDPGFLAADGRFYLYGTEGDGRNVQTITSTDLVTWTPGDDALPRLGAWALPRKTWAPEALLANGRYLLFYTAADRASGKQCIGKAVAASPAGPFVDESAAPFVCQADLGGSIDPDPITAPDGTSYLYWKSDGNCCGQPIHIWGQELDPSEGLLGKPVALLTNTQTWEGGLVEGPEMFTHDGRWVLFYAANSYSSDRYAEGWAACDGPLGPCTAAPEPLLASNTAAAGPGHGFVFDHSGQTWILYHAWPPDAIGNVPPGRLVWLDALHWTPHGPAVNWPNPDPQPVPTT